MAPEKTIGFIGGGEMAWAMVCGFISGEGLFLLNVIQ